MLAVQASDLILDLAAASGLGVGWRIELWRPIRLRHPVTGRTIEDRFRIGTLTLTQVRPHLSLAVPEGALERAPQPGDVVIAVAETASSSAAATAAEAAIPPALVAPAESAAAAVEPGAADGAELSQLFDALRGSTPEQRIAAYVAFAKAHPGHRHRATLLEQASQLRELIGGKAAPRASVLTRHEPPELALVGQPLSLAVQLGVPREGVLLHYKPAASSVYQTVSASSAGGTFFVIRVPGDAVRDDGLSYFMETVDAAGQARRLVGTSEAPITVATRRNWDIATPRRPAATVQLSADYADFNRLRNNDRDYRLEVDFGLRLNDLGLRALRSGFGVYRGVGGTLVDLDELGKSARQVGLTYGYLEAEYALRQSFSLIGRTLLGLNAEGVRSGLQAHVRIGSDRATNVTLGGELLGSIGVRGITQLTIAPLSRFPIVLRSEVGNQPAGVVADAEHVRPEQVGAPVESTSTGESDVGVRGIVQVGYRVLPELVLSARASYQGRNINHSGPGFGGAVQYSW